MEFTIRQPALLKELEVLHGVVERKSTVPILANVLLSATSEGLELMATDLEVSVRTKAAAAVRKEGGVSVQARKLYEIVRLLPDADVTVKEDGEHWVSVVCDRSRFRIMGLAREDFPTFPSPGKITRVRIPGPLLRKMVERVIFAVTSDDARFALNGALMILKGESIRLVASDGHRLALASESMDGKGTAEEERVLVPRKALVEISRIAADREGDVFYCRHENHLFFEVGACQLASRILEGTFPNFEKVVPAGNDKEVDVARVDLMTALTRVSVLANERSRAVRLAVKDGKAEVSSRNPEMGDASEVLPVSYNGDDIEIGFNAKYILEFLEVAGSEQVRLVLKDEVTQGLIHPVGDQADTYTYVVMPMRL